LRNSFLDARCFISGAPQKLDAVTVVSYEHPAGMFKQFFCARLLAQD
jgi:hypothetical protein